jgi:hypothetical protein
MNTAYGTISALHSHTGTNINLAGVVDSRLINCLAFSGIADSGRRHSTTANNRRVLSGIWRSQ